MGKTFLFIVCTSILVSCTNNMEDDTITECDQLESQSKESFNVSLDEALKNADNFF